MGDDGRGSFNMLDVIFFLGAVERRSPGDAESMSCL